MSYKIYNRINITVTFTLDGVAADPTAVAFKIETPAGIETMYEYGVDTEITKSSTGIYVMSFVPDEYGKYKYAARSTGASVDRFSDGEIEVDRPLIDFSDL
jgi:hypothetical protein